MQYIDSFIKYLKFERRNSEHTIVAYECDLGQFEQYLSEQGIESWAEVTAKTIRSWVVQFLEDGLSARSVNRKIASLKTFFKFLLREGVLEINPTEKVVSPKMPKRLPVFVKEVEMDFLLDQVDFGQDYSGVRDKLIIDVFYFTGMRLSELVNLKISQIDFGVGVLKILGKRNKERIVPITDVLKNSLIDYFSVRSEAFPDCVSDFVFLTNKGVKVYHKLVYRVVNKYLKMVSTVTKKSPHVIRHSFATALLNRGADLNAIKELLGHSNLSATEVYTHNSFEQLNSVYNQAHPRA